MKRPKVDLDLRPYFQGEEPTTHKKTLIVLHETVSHEAPGLSDIRGVAAYLDSTGLEIHGIIDKEGHSAWAYEPEHVYDHVLGANPQSVGFEQVSDIPFLATNAQRKAAWLADDRKKQLDKVAEWCAWLHQRLGIPLRYSDASVPGITSHWDVSNTFLGGSGHWDCHPIHRGGHYPILYVVNKAKQIWEGR
jgi:hypothetical protein